MCSRLINYIERFHILSDAQFGFRSGLSTSDALVELTENIYESLNAKKFHISTFLDIRKAFDTVPHSILLEKLEQYGIRGFVNNWFTSYQKDC